VLTSLLFTTGVAVLVVGAIAAVILARRASIDPTADVIAAVVAGLFVYGPTLLVNLWPATLPLIAAVGVSLAFLRRRIPIPRWLEIVVMAYGGFVVLAALAM